MVDKQRFAKFIFFLILLLFPAFGLMAEKAEEGEVDLAPVDNTTKSEITTQTPEISSEAGAQLNDPKDAKPASGEMLFCPRLVLSECLSTCADWYQDCLASSSSLCNIARGECRICCREVCEPSWPPGVPPF